LAVIDINYYSEQGLTNRSFEVLSTQTKLIIFNNNIKSYDF